MSKKLYISTSNMKIFGVCGGIAEYLNVDSTIIRIIAILLIFQIPIIPIIYLILWFFMPDRDNVKTI